MLLTVADFQLIAFTHPDIEEGEAERITGWLETGFSRVHLRKPRWEAQRVDKLLQRLSPTLWPRITLHDHEELALAYGTGFQTNSRNPSVSDEVVCHSHSCHSMEQARLSKRCDYVTLSPVYPSISKPGYDSQVNLIAEVRAADKTALPPLIALGGVTFEKLDELRNARFAGAAMLGALYK